MSDAFVLPAARSRRRRAMLAGSALGVPGLLAGCLLLVAALTSTTLCGGIDRLLGGIGDAHGKLSAEVTRAIDAVSARFDVDPYVVGALSMRESAGGADPSCSGAGACGVMQLMPDYWRASQCDGDGDGHAVITDVYDNVCAAVNGLLHEKHTLVAGRRMSRTEIESMARSYCGSCTARACGGGVDGGYCEGVVRDFVRLGGTFADGTAPGHLTAIPVQPSTASACIASASPVAGPGGWTVAPGANVGGRPLSPLFVAFMNTVARYTSYRPVLTTGTNHSEYTVDGSVSDHYAGNAGDFGSTANAFGTDDAEPGRPAPRGDELAAAALIAAGIDPVTARAWALDGGLRNVTFEFGGRRIRVQVIWKTSVGGDHHNHVHIGVRPA